MLIISKSTYVLIEEGGILFDLLPTKFLNKYYLIYLLILILLGEVCMPSVCVGALLGKKKIPLDSLT